MTSPPRDLYDGDVIQVGLTATRPDGTAFAPGDYATHTARVDFFNPTKSPRTVPADRTVDEATTLAPVAGGGWAATIPTAGWTAGVPTGKTRWTARYVITGQYARETYLSFTLNP